MAATTFDALAAWNQSLILRPLKGAVLIGDEDAVIPASFTSGASAALEELTGFTSLGYIAKDAPPSFSPSTEVSEVESWGALEPTRSDIISRNLTVSVTAQETKKKTLELYSGRSLDAVQADAVTHEVQWTDAVSPETIYHRLIFMFIDGSGSKAVYRFIVLPRAQVTEIGEQSWSPDGAVTYPFTFAAKIDPVLGYSANNVFGGPGATTERLTAMGFTVATP